MNWFVSMYAVGVITIILTDFLSKWNLNRATELFHTADTLLAWLYWPQLQAAVSHASYIYTSLSQYEKIFFLLIIEIYRATATIIPFSEYKHYKKRGKINIIFKGTDSNISSNYCPILQRPDEYNIHLLNLFMIPPLSLNF